MIYSSPLSVKIFKLGLCSKGESIECGSQEYFLYAQRADAATKIMSAYTLSSLEQLMLTCKAFCYFSRDSILFDT